MPQRRPPNQQTVLIEKALAYHHRRDMFFLQVSCGASHLSQEVSIVDAVAVHPSWKKPCITIYEIKVSRQDYLRDSKWHSYLPHCHRFAFACPPGLVKPEEVPDPAGLVVCSGKGVRTVKKMPLRPVEMDWKLLFSLVINKLDTDHHYLALRERERTRWELWLKDKKKLKDLGYRVGIKLNQHVQDLIDREKKLEKRELRIERLQQEYEKMKEILKPLGFPHLGWQRQLKELVARELVKNSKAELHRAMSNLQKAQDILNGDQK